MLPGLILAFVAGMITVVIVIVVTVFMTMLALFRHRFPPPLDSDGARRATLEKARKTCFESPLNDVPPEANERQSLAWS